MIPIVVIAYNRADSLKRILSSIAGADYAGKKDIVLIISIDGGDNEDVVKSAGEFEWKYGEKVVKTHDENLGLKKHVLECGDLAYKYGSVLMLEDDLEVAPSFYSYSLQALEFASKIEKTGGISLYNHLLNVHVREPFYAIDDGYDNYYFQFASSWGQLYSKKMWDGFRKWLGENDGKVLSGMEMPANVSGWSENSWLKYNIRYLIEKDLYFLYPRVSLTTNHMETGTHSKEESYDLQVPMMYGREKKYNFSLPGESLAVYDAFFENERIRDIIADSEKVERSDCLIDLYGYRERDESGKIKRLLSSRSLPYRIIKSYGRVLRPIEANIISNTPGRDLFLYDLQSPGQAPKVDSRARYLYDHRALKFKEMAGIISSRVIKR